MSRRAVMFTVNYPFTHTGGETMFIGPEAPHMVRAFGRLLVVPLHDTGRMLEVPEHIDVDRSLASRWRLRRPLYYLRALLWPGFLKEFVAGLRRGGAVGAARVWRWAAIATATWRWMEENLREGTPALLYTYWRGGQTLASVRWAARDARCAAVSRVHRYELYEEAFTPAFQPWSGLYAGLHRVAAISQHGADYLTARGIDRDRVIVARLGVPAAPRRADASMDGAFRVLSCSSATATKRVEMSAAVLVQFARRHPTRRVEWHHFGGGPSMAAVERITASRPPNLQVVFPGHVANQVIRTHYETHPVDLFMLLSESEGLPVAVQEALSYGVPVLATDVGGVCEAVDASGANGALVAVDAPMESILAALDELLLGSQEAIDARRSSAWRAWADRFDADANHAAFATHLLGLKG